VPSAVFTQCPPDSQAGTAVAVAASRKGALVNLFTGHLLAPVATLMYVPYLEGGRVRPGALVRRPPFTRGPSLLRASVDDPQQQQLAGVKGRVLLIHVVEDHSLS